MWHHAGLSRLAPSHRPSLPAEPLPGLATAPLPVYTSDTAAASTPSGFAPPCRGRVGFGGAAEISRRPVLPSKHACGRAPRARSALPIASRWPLTSQLRPCFVSRRKTGAVDAAGWGGRGAADSGDGCGRGRAHAVGARQHATAGLAGSRQASLPGHATGLPRGTSRWRDGSGPRRSRGRGLLAGFGVRGRSGLSLGVGGVRGFRARPPVGVDS